VRTNKSIFAELSSPIALPIERGPRRRYPSVEMPPSPPRVLTSFLLAVAARRARPASSCSAATAAVGAAAAHRLGRQVGPALGATAAPAPTKAAMGATSGSSDANDSERLRPATKASSTAGHLR